MTIELKPEQEQLIGRAIQAGVISAADDVLNLGVAAIRLHLELHGAPGGAQTMDAEQWSREFHSWLAGHPADTPLLSDEAMSRDSIYEIGGM